MAYKEQLSILIPMFNEERTVGAVLTALRQVDFPVPIEIIVVDDGSTDGSAAIVSAGAAADRRIRLIRKANGGKGTAIRAALAAATGTIAIVQDADLEYDPREIAQVIAPILEQQAAVVFGSRILEFGRSRYTALRYYLGGRVITALTNLLFNAQLTDEPTCYKAVRLPLLRDLDLTCDGFDFCAELTGKLLRRGVAIVEVPISYRPRSVAEGKKIGFRDALQAVRVLVRERLRPGVVPVTVEAAAVVVQPKAH